ncbi:MAG: hypothetical protein LUG45_10230 [Clostridiales bacterium]|nr:hypothetical protein [Clostridiales bacterium]
MIKVIIAAADSVQRRALKETLLQNDSLTLSAVTDCGSELLALLDGQPPDILLVGQELADRSGLQMLSELRGTAFLQPDVVFAFSGGGTGSFQILLNAMECPPDRESHLAAPGLALYQADQMGPVPYRRLVADFLFALGIPANVKGYRYLMWSLEQIRQDPELLNLLTKALYPMVGRQFRTKDGAAERAMRHTIGTAFCQGDQTVWASYFPSCVHGRKPTNGEFLAGAHEALRQMEGRANASD